jgi:hypothetical protein
VISCLYLTVADAIPEHDTGHTSFLCHSLTPHEVTQTEGVGGWDNGMCGMVCSPPLPSNIKHSGTVLSYDSIVMDCVLLGYVPSLPQEDTVDLFL